MARAPINGAISKGAKERQLDISAQASVTCGQPVKPLQGCVVVFVVSDQLGKGS